MIRTRAAALVATSALAVSLLSGCGILGTKSNASSGTRSAAGQGFQLTAKQVGQLANVVTDSQGMTLYRFDKDTAKPPATNCDGPCAQKWPPLTTTATEAQLNGIDKKLIGTIARRDGSVQITLNGWPLYRYAEDKAPGEAKGQGAGGTWFAVTADGKKAQGGAVGGANTGSGASTGSNAGSGTNTGSNTGSGSGGY
jgi:predicted lipoprotein with Yx(FWY)xxD motif